MRDEWREQMALDAALRIMESDKTSLWQKKSLAERANHVRGLASEFYQWLPDKEYAGHKVSPKSRLVDMTDDTDALLQAAAERAEQG